MVTYSVLLIEIAKVCCHIFVVPELYPHCTHSGEPRMQTENRHHGNGRIRVVLKADHKELQQQDWAERIAFPR